MKRLAAKNSRICSFFFLAAVDLDHQIDLEHEIGTVFDASKEHPGGFPQLGITGLLLAPRDHVED